MCVWGQSLLFPLHDKYRALQTEHFPSFAFQNKRPIYIGLQSIIVELEYVQTIIEQVTRYNSPYWCNTIFPLVALLEFFVSVATCEHLFLHQQPHYMMLYPIVKFLKTVVSLKTQFCTWLAMCVVLCPAGSCVLCLGRKPKWRSTAVWVWMEPW